MTSRLGVQSKSGRCILLAYWGLSPVRIPPVILFHQPPGLFSSPKSHYYNVLNLLCSEFLVLFLCCVGVSTYNKIRLKCLKNEADYWVENDLVLHSDLLFTFSFLLLTWCCNVGKKKKQKKKRKENVKSCIIYEICIKEKCNSIINKILIQFLEPVVRLKFVINV